MLRKTALAALAVRTACPLLLATLLGLAPALAQAPQRPLQNRWPGETQQLPQRGAEDQASAPTARPAARKPAPPSRVIACGGVFARDSSHLKLATFFGADAITWGQVDGPDGTKLNASVLYPADPKRRLEVLWNLEASRSDLQLIAINGQSTWVAPRGLKLGLTLAALEKINGRPFKLAGFGGEDAGLVASWEDGALAKLPGGCKVGVRFGPDPRASADARSAASGKELLSSDPLLRAASPKVEEILIGYGQ